MRLKSRFGIIKVDSVVLETRRQDIQAVMAKVIVLSCVHDYCNDHFVYKVYCDDLPVVKLGQVIPFYDTQIDKEGKVSFHVPATAGYDNDW